MSFIKKKAEQFVYEHIERGISSGKEVVESAKSELYDIDDDLDKVTFLNVILGANKLEYDKHLLVCTNKNSCPENHDHETITYYLTQELKRIIPITGDQFSSEEAVQAESKLDDILKEVKSMKEVGNEHFQKIQSELNELRDLYILGKKKWYQLLIGKSADMVLSGIVSETVAKKIVETVATELPKLSLVAGIFGG